MTHLSPFAFTLTVYLLICTFSNTFSYPLHRADQIDSAYQYELAVNQQPQVRARNQQPIRYVRNDDYFEDGPGGNSSFFVLGLFAIIIGVPCVLCYAQKHDIFACCGDEEALKASRKSKRSKSRRRRHKRSKSRKSRRRDDENSDDEDSDASLDDDGSSDDSDSPGGHQKKSKRSKRHRRSKSSSRKSRKKRTKSGDADERKMRKREEKKERQRKLRMLNSNLDQDTPVTLKFETPNREVSTTSATPSALTPTLKTAETHATPATSEAFSKQQQSEEEDEEVAYVVYRPDTKYMTVSRSLKNLVPPNTTVVYKVDETSNMNEVGSVMRSIKSRKPNGANDGTQSQSGPFLSPTSLHTLPGSPNSGKTACSMRSNYFIVNSNVLLEQQSDKKDHQEEEKVLVEDLETKATKQQQEQKKMVFKNSSPIKTNSTMFVYSTKTRFAKWPGLTDQPPPSQQTTSSPPQSIMKPLESLPFSVGPTGGFVDGSEAKSSKNVHFSTSLLDHPEHLQQLSPFGSGEEDSEEDEEDDDSSDEILEEEKKRSRRRARRHGDAKHRKHRHRRHSKVPARKKHRLKRGRH